MKDERLVLAFADFETAHELDIEHDLGMTTGIVGNELHLFRDGEDTGMIPETYVKCGGVIVVDKNGASHEFMTHSVQELLSVLRENEVDRCYFHNLKFDEMFISSVIMRAGGSVDIGEGWTAEVTKRLMGRRGVLYSTTIRFKGPRDPAKHRRPTHSVQLWDSAKVWANRLDTIGKDFGIPKGHEALRVGCDEELESYCLQDCRIVMKAMMWYFRRTQELAGRPYGWMTAASTAYHLGVLDLRNRIGTKMFDEYFPDCTEANGFPDWLREGYKGATPLLDPALRNRLIRNIRIFDINSMYPYQMVNMPLPVGKPVKLTEEQMWRLHDKGGLWVAKVRIVADVKPGHRATFMYKRRKDGDVLAWHIDSYDTLDMYKDNHEVITSVDMRLLERDYDIRSLEVIEAYGFSQRTGLFKDFLTYWYDMKDKANQQGDKALKAFAKLVINSFYGKFGTNPERESCDYVLNEDGCLRVVTSEETDVDEHPLYLPFAMFTTAYARDLISRACNVIGWDHVVYTDTDSLHIHGMDRAEIISRLEAEGIHSNNWELGAFKDETWDYKTDTDQSWAYGVYVRAKGYMHAHEDGRIDVSDIKMAGANGFDDLPESIFDVIGKDLYARQKGAFKVIGGIMLADRKVEVDLSDYGQMEHRVRVKGKSMEASKRILKERLTWDSIRTDTTA